MYNKILAAVNEFTNSETAARYAVALAKSCEARLYLVYVVREGIHPDVLRRAEAALMRLLNDAEAAGVEAEAVTLTGNPVDRLTAWAGENRVDVAFFGTRREDVKMRFFVKSAARELMLRLPCSAVMVRAVRMGKAHPGHILVPFGGRAKGVDEMTFFVARLAQGFGSKVTLFHKTRPLTKFFHGEVHLSPTERESLVPDDVGKYAASLSLHCVPHEKRTAHGRVSHTITTEAAVRRNDLIVMGASQRSLISRLIKGNPVEEVLQDTPCDLMIFRPGHENT